MCTSWETRAQRRDVCLTQSTLEYDSQMGRVRSFLQALRTAPHKEPWVEAPGSLTGVSMKTPKLQRSKLVGRVEPKACWHHPLCLLSLVGRDSFAPVEGWVSVA